MIFQSVYKYSINPLSFYPYKRYLKNSKSILEYGCGIAPITYSALKYGNFKKYRFTIADIKNYSYHFAKWRLAGCNNVFFIDIDPQVLPKFRNKFDLVFLMTVLEHLPNPLQIVKHIYKNMDHGAYLIFDYIKSDGRGLDTIEAVKERNQVLDFVKYNFELITGKIDMDNSMGTTIVRKN